MFSVIINLLVPRPAMGDDSALVMETAFPADAAAYYRTLVTATDRFEAGDCAAAVPPLRLLTAQFAADGATWLMLGMCLERLQDRVAARPALERALSLGAFPFELGFGASGTAPVNANDLMLMLAGMEAKSGNVSASLAWLERSLNARLDERPSLSEDERFAALHADPRFQQLAGSPDSQSDRVSGWRSDLAFLRDEMDRLHPRLEESTNIPDLDAAFAALAAQSPHLSDAQMTAETGRLLGLLGNGHNLLLPFETQHAGLPLLPFVFYWFSDGLHVIDASEGYEQWVGSRVERFGLTPATEAMLAMQEYIAHDNEVTALWIGPLFLASPHVLKAMSLIEDPDRVELHLLDTEGTRHRVADFDLAPFTLDTHALRPLRVPDRTPGYLRHVQKPFWADDLGDPGILYVQVNDIQDAPDSTLAEFANRLRQDQRTRGHRYLVLDLRHNAGGNGYLSMPLLRLASHFELACGAGSVFVLIGRNTFSAAHNLLVDIDRVLEGAILVGEPTPTRPNTFAESAYFRLPWSGLMGLLSSQLHQASWPEDSRKWIAPHVPISLSSEDYFSGRDPALDAVVSLVRQERRSSCVTAR